MKINVVVRFLKYRITLKYLSLEEETFGAESLDEPTPYYGIF